MPSLFGRILLILLPRSIQEEILTIGIVFSGILNLLTNTLCSVDVSLLFLLLVYLSIRAQIFITIIRVTNDDKTTKPNFISFDIC